MKGSMQWIRDHYPVPAARGVRVTFDGRAGRIVSADAPYLILHLDGDPPSRRVRVHPTWRMQYNYPQPT